MTEPPQIIMITITPQGVRIFRDGRDVTHDYSAINLRADLHRPACTELELTAHLPEFRPAPPPFDPDDF